jgi:hypothetical protein
VDAATNLIASVPFLTITSEFIHIDSIMKSIKRMKLLTENFERVWYQKCRYNYQGYMKAYFLVKTEVARDAVVNMDFSVSWLGGILI